MSGKLDILNMECKVRQAAGWLCSARAFASTFVSVKELEYWSIEQAHVDKLVIWQ